MENTPDNKSIYRAREKYRQKAFLIMLEIAVIIALPAFAAFFLAKYLNRNSQNGSIYTIILLTVSFIFSWVIIIIKYSRFSKKVREIDKKIKELKEKCQ